MRVCLVKPNFLLFVRFLCSPVKEQTVLVKSKRFLVPQKPIKSKIDPNKLPLRTKINADTIALLERLSLVDCANKQGIETLEEAIAFADQIQQVDTKNIEPLITVLEDRPLSTRADEITEGNCRKEILQNATITEEEYFVAPPGNIPLETRDNLLYDEQHPESDKSILHHSKRTLENFQIGASGALLLENLRQEWFNSIIINKDIQVFPSCSNFLETFNFAKELSLGVYPFGITQVVPRKQTLEAQFRKQEERVDFTSFLENDEILRCWIFLNPGGATQFFHQWQRERRMWWRKFSISPGRYSETDMKNGKVDILAKYPWGEHLVETLGLTTEIPELKKTDLQIREGKKTLQAQIVTSEIFSSTMFFNALCDAYDEPLFQNNPRPLLRFHRKLAPYKISFAIPSGPKAIVDELKDLALYLCRQLRKIHISCLLLPVSYKTTLESQWKLYDQMGIPYNLLLNEQTLKTGIAQLRSRDTTLKEQIHVTDLPTYVEKILRNY